VNIKNLISELKRRNVFRIATAYTIVGWLIIQVASSVFPIFDFPEWTSQFVIILVIIGFPIALIIAWAFELTPEGLKKSEEVETDESITPKTGKKLNTIIIASLSLLIVFLLAERIFFAESTIGYDSDGPVLAVSDKSIAVLPFDDFNVGGDQEYFADGLTEEILNSLAKTPDLLVASRTSSFQYKNKNIDITRIADTLGVAHVLEGSVRSSAEKYRITAQLIRASDGFHLWSQTYDQPKADIIDIQEDIAFRIASALETAMDPEALKNMLKAGTSSIEAYTKYLEGLSLFYSGDLETLTKSYTLFEEARELDPSFSEAHFSAAGFWLRQLSPSTMGSDISDKSYSDKLQLFNERIEQAIQHAAETDKLKYQALQAEVNLQIRKSISLASQYVKERPNDIDNLWRLINLNVYLGEYEKALEYNNQLEGIALENVSSYILVISGHVWSKDFEKASKFSRKAVEIFPYNEGVLYQAHRALLWGGYYDEARTIASKLSSTTQLGENKWIAALRQACADNETDKAIQIYNEYIVSGGDIGVKLLSLYLLDGHNEAYTLIEPFHENDELYSLASFLYYPYFDARKFPKMQEILAREQAKRGEPVEIPFRCGR